MKKPARKQQFKVVIERDEDGFFVASVPTIPGCHTQAKTIPELLTRVRDAIRLCLSVARSDRSYRQKMSRFAYEPSFVGMVIVDVT